MRKIFLSAILTAFVAHGAWAEASAKAPILIGDISVGAAAPEYAIPVKNAIDLAVAHINAKGGVLGRPLKILHRDGKLNPGEAVRLAEELTARDKVAALISGEGSSSTLALSSWAGHKKMPLVIAIADADSPVWEQGNPYVFRTIFGGYMEVSAVLHKAAELYGDKLKKKRWAIIGPNYEYGRSLVKYAKIIVQEKGFEPEWVVEQWPAFGKMDAGATVGALVRAKPDIIFNVLLTDDLAKFVREGTKRGLFKDKIVLAPPAALPEHFAVLGAEVPTGWISIGFPSQEITDPGFVALRQAYKAAYDQEQTAIVPYAYNAVHALAAAIEKAGTADDPQKLRDALAEVTYETPFGPEKFRKIDGQAETVFWVGVSGLKDGKPALFDWKMEKAADHLPPDSFILERRKNP